MKARIWLALIAVYIVWGSTYLAIRFAVESMPPFMMAGIRFVIAGAILFIWRILAGDKKPVRFEWRSTAIVGLLLLLGGNGNVVWAEQRVASGVAALIIGSTPIWMVSIDALRPGGTKASLQTWIGVIIGFIGILILISPWNIGKSSQQSDLLGMMALLLGAFLWALGSIYSRSAKLPDSPLLGTGMEMLTGGAGLLALSFITREWVGLDLSAISTRSIISLIYLILFGSLIGYSAYTWLLRNAPTPLVSTYAYVNPMVAILLGSLLADEVLTSHILLSAVIVVSSVVLINTARPKKPKSITDVETAPIMGDD